MESFETTDIADLGGSGLMQTSSKVTRRTVMATGLAAAWTIPTIQMAVAAPMTATSGQAALLFTASSGGYQPAGSRNLATSFTLKNNTGRSTSSLQVTYTFPSGWSPAISQVDGWQGSAGKGSSKNVITYTANVQLAPGASVSGSPVLTVVPGHAGLAVSIQVSATATGATGTSTTINVT